MFCVPDFIATNKDEKAIDAARYFIQHVVKTHGLPRSVLCDRDSKFLSLFWQTMMQPLGVSARTTSGFHPQAKGQAERTNQTLRQYLRVYATHSPDSPDGLATAEMAINNAPLEGTKFSPYELNLGYCPCLATDAFWEATNRPGQSQPAKLWMKQMET